MCKTFKKTFDCSHYNRSVLEYCNKSRYGRVCNKSKTQTRTHQQGPCGKAKCYQASNGYYYEYTTPLPKNTILYNWTGNTYREYGKSA